MQPRPVHPLDPIVQQFLVERLRGHTDGAAPRPRGAVAHECGGSSRCQELVAPERPQMAVVRRGLHRGAYLPCGARSEVSSEGSKNGSLTAL